MVRAKNYSPFAPFTFASTIHTSKPDDVAIAYFKAANSNKLLPKAFATLATTVEMFFLYNLERQVTLHPSYFGRNMHELVTGKLLKDVEGTCTGRYFIITIMDTFNISEGRILPGSGLAEFTVGYRAVIWRPFKGETVRNRP